jgi:acyl-CoA thioester hydrolase
MTGQMEAFRGVAHPWRCDVFDHLNTRHHMAMFDDAGFHLLHAIGPDSATRARERKGWADVRLKVDLEAEVPKGALVVIRSRVVKLGRTSVTYAHVMHSADDDRRHSAVQVVTAFFDREARHAAPCSDVVRERGNVASPRQGSEGATMNRFGQLFNLDPLCFLK